MQFDPGDVVLLMFPYIACSVLLFGRGEVERPDLVIEARIPIPAAIIILDDLFERGKAAVVHVGRGAHDLAERRRLEIPLSPRVPLYFVPLEKTGSYEKSPLELPASSTT